MLCSPRHHTYMPLYWKAHRCAKYRRAVHPTIDAGKTLHNDYAVLMNDAYFAVPLEDFLATSDETILGELTQPITMPLNISSETRGGMKFGISVRHCPASRMHSFSLSFPSREWENAQTH